MRTRMILMSMCLALFSMMAHADETVTVTATSADISEDLDLKTVATLFGQAKDLEEFEKMLNNPDSAFSNLDLNGDGNVDYLRVIETADQNRHLIVIQAVLAKDIYQDVASIFVEKDEKNQVTVQVVGDEYIYGANYIIEPVYIYRPYIYDWFWGPSWVCWHSPYYWGYWPSWWHPFYCVDPFLYWDHCYWHHYHYPICSYRTGHHHHPHYASMRDRVRRNDFAQRHPERSFVTRNASRGMSNARALEASRRSAVREASSVTRGSATRVNSSRTTDRTFGSSAVRTAGSASRVSRTSTTATRGTSTATRSSSTKRSSAATPTRTSVTTSTRSSATTPSRTSVTTTPKRSTSTTVTRTSSSTPTRSSSSAVRSTSTSTRSSSSAVRSTSGSSMRSSGYSSGASTRSSSSGASRSGSGGSRTR